MICFPNAKINIGLRVCGRRPDGYHDIETVMVPLGGLLYDALEIFKNSDFRLVCSGFNIKGAEEDNLCMKAYKLLGKEYDLPPVSIRLHKAVPMGAGLGGGSADGAFMLKLLNDHFKLKISERKLAHYAAQLGSDCPFFIRNVPAMISGRGDKIRHLGELPQLNGKYIVIVYPGIHINTSWAYSQVDLMKKEARRKQYNFPGIKTLPMKKWKKYFHNDFEEAVFPLHPVLKKIKTRLYELGAVYASMSGSGSAQYGIFNNEPRLKNEFGNYLLWEGRI